MDSLTTIFLGSFIVGFSGAAMPGPMLAVVIRESAARGIMAGPLVVVGHALLEVATFAAILGGLGAYMSKPLFFGLTGLIGGSIIILMGLGMLKALPDLTLDVEGAPNLGMNPVVGGVVTSLSNPYFPLWWATAGLTLMGQAAQRGAPGQAAFFSGHLISDFVWYTLVSTLFTLGRSLVTPTRYRWLVGLLALMLIGFGLHFALEGSKRLLGI